MERSTLQEYIRVFFHGLLLLAALFLTAVAASFAGSFGGGGSDAAYGAEELSWENFEMPAEPLMEIWVWQKEETEKRELVTLKARTPVNTGPSVAWNGGLAEVYGAERFGGGADFTSELPFELNGLTVSVQTEGMISARWEHETGSDCGYTHTWWYSVDPDLTGGVDRMRLQRSCSAAAEGTNSLCILWRGQGGQPADTVTADGDPVYDAVHRQITLADVIGEDEEGLHAAVTQDSMSLLLYLESRDLLGRLLATAVVRVTMVSSWHGAGALYEKELPAILEAERRGETPVSRWIDYAVQPPTWTAELVWYSER